MKALPGEHGGLQRCLKLLCLAEIQDRSIDQSFSVMLELLLLLFFLFHAHLPHDFAPEII